MAVTITQNPTLPFDEAYGANPVTLSGIPTDPVTGVITADKYVLQIWSQGTLIADLRQSPNTNAVAIFDIQNTLQNFVAPSVNNIEEKGWIGDPLTVSANETVPYLLMAGYEVDGVVTLEAETPENFLAIGGKKRYYDVPYNVTPYIPALLTDGLGCTGYLKGAEAFTDLKEYRLASSITDGKPAWLTGSMRVYDHYVTRNDMTTLSYWNEPSGTGPALASCIEAITYYQYDGNTLIDQTVLYNLTGEGGGPNTATGQGITPVYPYKAITVASGPKNFQEFDSLNATHYYVTTQAYGGGGACESLIAEGSMHYVHRFNIIEETCNDYPEYQFSWLNSLGFRDYYGFSKRKDRSVSITRNEFLREAADYASTSYDVSIYDRGMTTYSQTLEQTYVAYTGYMSDADAKYLQGLFTSADVKVRFDDAEGADKYKWVPITLLSADYTEKTYRKDRLFQYELRFKIAHNIKSQRG